MSGASIFLTVSFAGRHWPLEFVGHDDLDLIDIETDGRPYWARGGRSGEEQSLYRKSEIVVLESPGPMFRDGIFHAAADRPCGAVGGGAGRGAGDRRDRIPIISKACAALAVDQQTIERPADAAGDRGGPEYV